MSTPMKQAIVLGSNSDIYRQLKPLMEADGWAFWEFHRTTPSVDRAPQWDLLLVPMGKIAPVGIWHDLQVGNYTWDECMESNVLLPFRLLKRWLWAKRNAGAQVCFFAGSNPNMIMPGYSAYNVAKMALLKLVEQIDYETPAHKIFALNPGIVLTKIHKQSRQWPNPKLKAAREEDRSTPIERIYACLQWCMAQKKEVIGGRNICVSDPWETQPQQLTAQLATHQAMYKLRRFEL